MFWVFVEASVRIVLIAAVTAAMLTAFRIQAAAVRHAAWASVVLAMLLLPALLIWGPRASLAVLPGTKLSPGSASSFVAERILSPSDEAPPPASLIRRSWSLSEVLVSVYALGLIYFLGRLMLGTMYVRRLLRTARLEQGRAVHPACTTPVTVGWWRPKMILPLEWSSWPEEQLDTVLAHERAHMRRHDPLVLWIAQLNRAVFWCHPLAWWLERHVTVLAEAACDEMVLKSGCDPERYASTLIAFAHLGRIRGVIGVDAAQLRLPGPQLTTRIRSILAGSRSPAPSAFRLTLGAVLGALVFSLFAVGVPVHGQTTDLAFDVTSIKPNTQHFIDLGNGLRLLRGETRCNAADSAVLPGDPIPRPGVGRCIARNSTAKELINVAYGLQFGPVRAILNDLVIGGPSWTQTAAFDLDAKADDPRVTTVQLVGMLRTALRERFHLRFHRETRQMPALALLVAKDGHKLVLSSTDTPPTFTAAPVVRGQHVPIVTIVNLLSQRLAQPVVDETGLAGTYDFTLKWTPDPTELDASGVPIATRASDQANGSLTTALREQLGLRLETRRVAVDVFVIDSIEMPSEN